MLRVEIIQKIEIGKKSVYEKRLNITYKYNNITFFKQRKMNKYKRFVIHKKNVIFLLQGPQT